MIPAWPPPLRSRGGLRRGALAWPPPLRSRGGLRRGAFGLGVELESNCKVPKAALPTACCAASIPRRAPLLDPPLAAQREEAEQIAVHHSSRKGRPSRSPNPPAAGEMEWRARAWPTPSKQGRNEEGCFGLASSLAQQGRTEEGCFWLGLLTCVAGEEVRLCCYGRDTAWTARARPAAIMSKATASAARMPSTPADRMPPA